MKFLPARITEARKLAGLNQRQLATEVGVSYQLLQKWEYGKFVPNGENLIALAAALNKPTEYFFENNSIRTPDVKIEGFEPLGQPLLYRTAPLPPSKAKHIRQAKARLLAARDRLVQALEGQFDPEKSIRPTLKDVLAAVDEIDKLLE